MDEGCVTMDYGGYLIRNIRNIAPPDDKRHEVQADAASGVDDVKTPSSRGRPKVRLAP